MAPLLGEQPRNVYATIAEALDVDPSQLAGILDAPAERGAIDISQGARPSAYGQAAVAQPQPGLVMILGPMPSPKGAGHR